MHVGGAPPSIDVSSRLLLPASRARAQFPAHGLFRSLPVPLKAVIMNLLDRRPTGVVVAVFQWGWFGSDRGR